MLCAQFIAGSIRTWEDLVTSATLRTRLGEESITDYLVFELAKYQVLGNYKVQSFTKQEEKVNGADWELWLTGPSGKWFGLRLQAKVIKVGINRFPQLHKPQAPPGAQTVTQRLIASANAVSALPLYLLYSAWSPNPDAPSWSCGSYPKDDRLWGLTFVSANKILSIAPKTTLKALAPHMQTAHCMFCCSAFGGADLPARAHGFASSRLAEGEPKLLDRPPEHLLRLLENPDDLLLDDVWPDANLGRITILKQAETRPSVDR